MVAQDEIQQILMAMTMPGDVKLVIENLKDATSKIVHGETMLGKNDDFDSKSFRCIIYVR
ncbi:MAG: hypothetical protein Nk1A_4810 [Endomicrobiia bacterium]|nr:MAG: hypothetical protein Nk1A_4810 [Endomicrobiia bacterium]